MFKKVVALLMTCVLSMSLVGCSTSDSSDKTTTKKPATSNSIKIKDVNDFQEADGLIKYFTIDDILPNEPDRVCVHLDSLRDERWKCEECHQESCTTSKEKFKIVLDALCSRNVFQKFNDMYRFAT